MGGTSTSLRPHAFCTRDDDFMGEFRLEVHGDLGIANATVRILGHFDRKEQPIRYRLMMPPYPPMDPALQPKMLSTPLSPKPLIPRSLEPYFWVAVEELYSIYSIGETVSITIHAHQGTLM